MKNSTSTKSINIRTKRRKSIETNTIESTTMSLPTSGKKDLEMTTTGAETGGTTEETETTTEETGTGTGTDTTTKTEAMEEITKDLQEGLRKKIPIMRSEGISRK